MKNELFIIPNSLLKVSPIDTVTLFTTRMKVILQEFEIAQENQRFAGLSKALAQKADDADEQTRSAHIQLPRLPRNYLHQKVDTLNAKKLKRFLLERFVH